MELFELLDFLLWQIESLKEKINLVDFYSFELINKSFLEIPERIFFEEYEFYGDYIKDISLEHKKINNKFNNEYQKLQYLLKIYELKYQRLVRFILKNSTFSYKEINYLVNIYNIPVKLVKENKNISIYLLNSDNNIILNPIITAFFTTDMIDFIKFYLNELFKNFNISLIACLELYNTIDLTI